MVRPGNGRTSERSLARFVSTVRAEEGLWIPGSGGLDLGGVVFVGGLPSGDVVGVLEPGGDSTETAWRR